MTPGPPRGEQASYGVRDRARWVDEHHGSRSGRDDFARDRGRLIHSAALRRLSATTQVMEPDTDDFVRNRLTHSLEVAQIGREIGAALGCSADVVDTACLAHDLGHPPFGHNGEAALDELTSEIGGFEGNAQTFRLLTRLEAKRSHADGRSAGLNLTRASLDAACKYPWRRGDGPTPTRKFGVYSDDVGAFDWVRQGRQGSERCLEAQVMDWADDIAYSVHDVEDAIAGGRLDLGVMHGEQDVSAVYAVARQWYLPDASDDELGAASRRIVDSGAIPATYDGSRRDLAALKDMTSRLIGHFAGSAERATRDRHGPGPHARYSADLVVPRAVRVECAFLKAVAAHYVMLAPERLAVRDTERDVIADLVAAYVDRPERLDPAFHADFEAAESDDARRRVIVDQVASLSDIRALTLHGQWRG